MTEKTLDKYVMDGLKFYGWHCVKHNDASTPGIPDVSAYWRKTRRTVWIEDKVDGEEPSKEQKAFLTMRHGWILDRTGRVYKLTYWPTKELVREWEGSIPFDLLTEILLEQN